MKLLLLGILTLSSIPLSYADIKSHSDGSYAIDQTPSSDRRNYEKREKKKSFESSSEKRRQSGDRGVIDTEKQMEEHMPGDELRERTRIRANKRTRGENDYVRAE